MKLVRTFAACWLVTACALASAQEAGKIGFVNTERILRDAAPAKAAQQKLEQEFSRRDKELQELAARLKSLGEKLDRDAAITTDSERQRRQREIAEVEKEYQRKQREFREDLNQRRNEELSQVIDKANRVIKQIAEQEKYDLILQEAVFASPRIDITDKVLRALGNGKQ
ncbi:MAG: OmpH family outer membrane protein [Lautropia sp.]|nr:MAG: OmpH family outer membrane protein [Pseudomonadota bacterium]MBC6958467.1 OmpH family outer membrane protein [Lautropia sp.]MCL4700393.1 OmpH family outer membrane protein [Burkholderiaceae bacterium]MCZ2415708.1 OmpH family outer membrane protein [Burkholderiales bacterium]MDL1906937.1 OmpH family outer membrane protein [Betaproteobacteria bacterium PRO1]